MALHTSTGAMTKAQKARINAIKLETGCVCCRLRGLGYVEPDANHMLSGGRRKGHDFTYALCKWHHVGWLRDGYTTAMMTAEYGPSLAKGSKPFHAHFGSDEDLFNEQERLLLRFGYRDAA